MRRQRRSAKLLALTLGLVLFGAACGSDNDNGGGAASTTPGGEVPETPTGGTATYAAEQEYTSSNPNTTDDNLFANALVMNPILPAVYYLDDSADFVLDEVNFESAEVTEEDPQTITYKITPDAVWSDGEAIDCSDFYLAWLSSNGKSVAKNPDGTDQVDEDGNPVDVFNPVSTTGYENIGSVECSDDGKTVTATYEKPFADWKSLFSGLIPAHVVEAKSGVADVVAAGDSANDADIAKIADFWNTGFKADKGIDPTVEVSGGPYVIQTFNPGQDLTLARNDKYAGPKAQLDTVVFRLIEDQTAQPAALQNGEVNVITPQPNVDLLAQLKGFPNVTAEVNFGFTYEHLDFNFKSAILQDKAVRQAFAWCVDRQGLVDALVKPLSDKAVVVNNRFYEPFQSDYEDNSGDYAAPDIDKANKALDDAGWTKGSDGIREKDGQRLSIRIARKDPNPRRQQTVQLIADQCGAAGMEVKDQPDPDIFTNVIPQGNYEVALFAWVGSPVLSSNKSIFTTNGDQNYGTYGNTDADELLEQIDGELDEAARAEEANKVDQILWDDLATIPLFEFADLVAFSNDMTNVVYNPTQAGITWNVQKWQVKA